MNKNILQIAWGFLLVGIVISIYFTISSFCDGFRIYGKADIDFATTGQFGDFMGGVVGTIFTLVGNVLLFYTLRLQRESIRFNDVTTLSNNIITVAYNQLQILDLKFAKSIFYDETNMGFDGILKVNHNNGSSPKSIFQKVSSNEKEPLLDFIQNL